MHGTPEPRPQGSNPRRLLVRGVNWLGDAVMTTPALRRLREALPGTHITLLTRSKLAELWQAHPTLDDILCIEPGDSVWTVGRKIRLHDFDAALVLPNSPRSAMEVFLGRIPRRIGYQKPWRNWLLTEAVPARPGHVRMRKRDVPEIKRLITGNPQTAGRQCSTSAVPPTAHQSRDYLHLVSHLGANPQPTAPELHVTQAEVAAARSKFDILAEPIWVGINAGAEYGPAKRWPGERFSAVAAAVQQQNNCGFLIFGGPGDMDLATQLAGAMESARLTVRNLAGRTSLRELMALLSCCRALLTNDTGPMHVAAALGVPVIVPFGSTSPEMTGPGLPGDPQHRLIKSDAPCSPCFLRECPIDFRCMEEIGVGQVTEEVLVALQGKAAEPRRT